jgi:hypothetical protein
MSFRLGPVAEQTAVLTGAPSGIGRARRNPGAGRAILEELNPLAEECRARSGRALYPVLQLTSPMLAVHGESSEERQYDGRAVDANWTCRFHRRSEALHAA